MAHHQQSHSHMWSGPRLHVIANTDAERTYPCVVSTRAAPSYTVALREAESSRPTFPRLSLTSSPNPQLLPHGLVTLPLTSALTYGKQTYERTEVIWLDSELHVVFYEMSWCQRQWNADSVTWTLKAFLMPRAPSLWPNVKSLHFPVVSPQFPYSEYEVYIHPSAIKGQIKLKKLNCIFCQRKGEIITESEMASYIPS